MQVVMAGHPPGGRRQRSTAQREFPLQPQDEGIRRRRRHPLEVARGALAEIDDGQARRRLERVQLAR